MNDLRGSQHQGKNETSTLAHPSCAGGWSPQLKCARRVQQGQTRAPGVAGSGKGMWVISLQNCPCLCWLTTFQACLSFCPPSLILSGARDPAGLLCDREGLPVAADLLPCPGSNSSSCISRTLESKRRAWAPRRTGVTGPEMRPP